jgi:excisionase family DNA binding protein
MTTKQNLVVPDQAADHLSVSVRTLAKWRSTGENNIPYTKIGRCVRYRLSDLDAYIQKHSHNSVEVQ